MRELKYSHAFRKQYKKLPEQLKQKFAKQLDFFLLDTHYPSLHTSKMPGTEKFESRLDYHYRFTFILSNNEIWFLTIGPHDEGLGKK